MCTLLQLGSPSSQRNTSGCSAQNLVHVRGGIASHAKKKLLYSSDTCSLLIMTLIKHLGLWRHQLGTTRARANLVCRDNVQREEGRTPVFKIPQELGCLPAGRVLAYALHEVFPAEVKKSHS